MKQYFLEIMCYQPKNKAHEELQQFVREYNHCLVDEENMVLVKSQIKQKILEVNNQHTRCQNIELSGWRNNPANERIAVEGNFYLDIKQVERFELTRFTNMEPIEIKIDRSTLPADGQKIKWQTYDDFNNQAWKEGTFNAGDDLFTVGFSDTAHDWNQSFGVLHWLPIQ